MCIDNRREIDLAGINLLLQHRAHSSKCFQFLFLESNEFQVILRNVGWIDYHSILGLFVYNKVGIVVVGPQPYNKQACMSF